MMVPVMMRRRRVGMLVMMTSRIILTGHVTGRQYCTRNVTARWKSKLSDDRDEDDGNNNLHIQTRKTPPY